jgi:hypothetical protein
MPFCRIRFGSYRQKDCHHSVKTAKGGSKSGGRRAVVSTPPS